jgi:hypothetical protein
MSAGAFLSGRLHRGFFGYYHEILAEPPVIVPARNGHTFSTYFESGSGHVLRILYGDRHVTVETLHSICDGRGADGNRDRAAGALL